MKQKLLLIVASLFLCGCTPKEKEPDLPSVVGLKNKVIILAGQSNMEGHDAQFSGLSEETRDKYKSGHDNVKIIYDKAVLTSDRDIADEDLLLTKLFVHALDFQDF